MHRLLLRVCRLRPQQRPQTWDLNSYNSTGGNKIQPVVWLQLYQTLLKCLFLWQQWLCYGKKQGTECVGCFSGSWSLTRAGKQMDALIRRRRSNINRLWISSISFGRTFFYFQVIEVWAHSGEGFQLIRPPPRPLITFTPLDFAVNASSRWARLCFFTFWKDLRTSSDHQRGPRCQITTNIIY